MARPNVHEIILGLQALLNAVDHRPSEHHVQDFLLKNSKLDLGNVESFCKYHHIDIDDFMESIYQNARANALEKKGITSLDRWKGRNSVPN